MTNLEPRKEKDKDQCNEKYGQTMRVHDCLPQLDHQEQDGTLSTAQHWIELRINLVFRVGVLP